MPCATLGQSGSLRPLPPPWTQRHPTTRGLAVDKAGLIPFPPLLEILRFFTPSKAFLFCSLLARASFCDYSLPVTKKRRLEVPRSCPRKTESSTFGLASDPYIRAKLSIGDQRLEARGEGQKARRTQRLFRGETKRHNTKWAATTTRSAASP